MKLSNSTRQNVYGNILVGLSFMALTFLTIKTFAPDVRSNAETNTAEQTVGPYTASISLDSATAINITPTASQAVYTGTNEITYTNTCPYGFNVTMSSVDEDTNLTRLGDDSATKTIPTISSGTALTDNTWGYSTDGGTTYNAIPALANPATIINTSAATTTAATLDLTYGVKTDNNLPSGSYINDLIYTVSVKPQCLSYGITWDMDGGTAASGADYPASLNFGSVLDLTALAPTKEGYIFTGWSNGTDTFDGTETAADINPSSTPTITMTAQWKQKNGIYSISNMQDMTPAICNATTTPSKTATTLDWDGSHHGDTNYVPRTVLTDTRDGNRYLISKLADGNCWMSQSLALDLTSGTPIEISNNDGTTSTATPNNTTQTTTGTVWAQSDNNWRSYHPQASESYYRDGTTMASSPTGSGDEYLWEKTGNYYNWYAATAGTGTSSMTNAEASASICPKGWRLPSATGTKSYGNLITIVYGLASSEAGSMSLRANPLNFNLAGGHAIDRSEIIYQGERGFYLSSSASSSSNISSLYLNASSIYPQYDGWKGVGFSVRCVAIGDTMQGFNPSSLEIGESKVLEDTRDTNTYTVAKLADGKVWMTENLRLVNKTISSDDSNLPTGESYTVPTSSASSFTSAYNTGAAYIDNTYGGYYNYYTATAGWGTNSISSGNTAQSICPRGWRLPTGGDGGELQTLYNNYNSPASMQGDPGFVLSGFIQSSALNDQGAAGYYWSSTIKSGSTTHTHNITIRDSGVGPVNYSYRYNGYAVRCVVEDRTISDITYMQDMSPKIVENTATNASATLTDRRDSKTYTVKKLKDGKVWMTKNLGLINKTITSADSNIPSGGTWTVPASSTSGFSAYNTNNAYLDSTYGGYYTFYTATAGWGTNSVTSGNAPKDICPKGWRLPTNGASGEYEILYYANYNSNALMRGDPGFVLSGLVNNSSIYNQGSKGLYWSSSVYSDELAYNLYLLSSTVEPVNKDRKYNGFSVRCVAK